MNLAPLRALVVDDEAHIRHYLALVLQTLGVGAVAQAGTVAEARAAQAAAPHDLILLDVNLPGASGLDWLHELRAADDEAVVVMISSQANAGLVTEAAEAGADGYLRKDMDRTAMTAELLRVIRNTLGEE